MHNKILMQGTNIYEIKVITTIKNYHQSVETNHNWNGPYIPDQP